MAKPTQTTAADEPTESTPPQTPPLSEAPAPTPERPWRIVTLPTPPGGIAIIPWQQQDSTVPATPITIPLNAPSQPLALPPLPVSAAGQAPPVSTLLFVAAYRIREPEPANPQPTQPPVVRAWVEGQQQPQPVQPPSPAVGTR